MIGLNLLPPPLKKSLRAHVVYAAVERLMIAACSLILLSSVLLLLIRIRMIRVLDEVQSRQILSAEYVTVNSEVKQLNGQIARVDILQRLQLSSSALLLDLARRTPKGVVVTSMDFDIPTASMRVIGVADQRENLLAYETAMKDSPYVQSLDSPISNLFVRSNANFQFKIVLNVAALAGAFERAP